MCVTDVTKRGEGGSRSERRELRSSAAWASIRRLHGGDEVLGQQGLQAEVDAQGSVLVFGFGQAADDEHRDVGGELAQAGDELGAVHAGHDVVGDDEVDGVREIVVAELLEGALGAEDGDDEIAGSLEDGLTGGGLDGVVVDEQKGVGHVSL